MACGVIPIGSNSGAIPKVIGENDNIFVEGDYEMLTSIIARKINQRNLDKEKYFFINKAKTEYHDEVISMKYVKIYQNFLKTKVRND